MPAPIDPDLVDRALAAYERGEKIADIEHEYGIDRSTLYAEMRARGRAPTRVQQKRLINRGSAELAKEAWERLAALGTECARLTRDVADLAVRNVALLEECDRLNRENAALKLEREAATPPPRQRRGKP